MHSTRARGRRPINLVRVLALRVLALAPPCACGDASPLLVELEIEAGTDPFADVAEIELRVAAPDLPRPVSRRAAYVPGGALRLPQVPLGQARVLTVEAIDDEGLVVARGGSAEFTLSEDEPARLSVPIARCTLVRYPDGDGDGQGDEAKRKTLCDPVEGFVEVGGDCADDEARAYLGQTEYQAAERRGRGGYDFDCDSIEEREVDVVVDCSAATPANCKLTSGWVDGVPACGEEGSFVQCQRSGPDCINEGLQLRVQLCR